MLAKCPHCKNEFNTEQVGLVDCPACNKPVFIKPFELEQEYESDQEQDSYHHDEQQQLLQDEVASSETETQQQHFEVFPASEVLHPEQNDNTQESTKPEQEEPKPITLPIWELPLPFSYRFIETIKQVCFSPRKFFNDLPHIDSKKSMWFGYLVSTLSLGIMFGIQYLVVQIAPGEIEKFFEQNSDLIQQAFSVEQYKSFSFILFVLSPLWGILPPYILAGSLHLSIWLMRLPNRSYDMTFRVATYSLAPLLLVAIPLPPIVFAATISVMILLLMGTSQAYKVSVGLSALIVIMPAFLAINIFLQIVFGVTMLLSGM